MSFSPGLPRVGGSGIVGADETTAGVVEGDGRAGQTSSSAADGRSLNMSLSSPEEEPS